MNTFGCECLADPDESVTVGFRITEDQRNIMSWKQSLNRHSGFNTTLITQSHQGTFHCVPDRQAWISPTGTSLHTPWIEANVRWVMSSRGFTSLQHRIYWRDEALTLSLFHSPDSSPGWTCQSGWSYYCGLSLRCQMPVIIKKWYTY